MLLFCLGPFHVSKKHYVAKGLISPTGMCTLVSGLQVQYLCLLTSFYPMFKLKKYFKVSKYIIDWEKQIITIIMIATLDKVLRS